MTCVVQHAKTYVVFYLGCLGEPENTRSKSLCCRFVTTADMDWLWNIWSLLRMVDFASNFVYWYRQASPNTPSFTSKTWASRRGRIVTVVCTTCFAPSMSCVAACSTSSGFIETIAQYIRLHLT